MYKVAETKFDQPKGVDLVTMDADGEKLPSDWYLQLAGAATKTLRGELPLQSTIPIDSGLPPLPTPTGTHRLRFEIATSSDWASLKLLGGGTVINMSLAEVSPGALNVGANFERLVVGQPIGQANNGKVVKLVVDVDLLAADLSGQLDFEIESGAIGNTTVTIYKIIDGAPTEAASSTLYEMKKQFSVPLKSLATP